MSAGKGVSIELAADDFLAEEAIQASEANGLRLAVGLLKKPEIRPGTLTRPVQVAGQL